MSIRQYVVACGLGVAAAHAALAQALPPPSILLQASFNLGASEKRFAFGSLDLTQPGFGAISVSAAGAPSPLLQAESSIDEGFGRGVATLDYNVRIDGPQGLVPVQVFVGGAASGQAGDGASFAVATRWSLFLDFSNPLASDQISSGQIFGGGFSQSFGRTVDVMMITNLAYTVSMVADVGAGADPGAHAHALASVDPRFEIGGGLDSSLYTVSLSPGVGNVAAVPEPGGWFMMTLGLLGLAIARRRAAAF